MTSDLSLSPCSCSVYVLAPCSNHIYLAHRLSSRSVWIYVQLAYEPPRLADEFCIASNLEGLLHHTHTVSALHLQYDLTSQILYFPSDGSNLSYSCHRLTVSFRSHLLIWNLYPSHSPKWHVQPAPLPIPFINKHPNLNSQTALHHASAQYAVHLHHWYLAHIAETAALWCHLGMSWPGRLSSHMSRNTKLWWVMCNYVNVFQNAHWANVQAHMNLNGTYLLYSLCPSRSYCG